MMLFITNFEWSLCTEGLHSFEEGAGSFCIVDTACKYLKIYYTLGLNTEIIEKFKIGKNTLIILLLVYFPT